MKKLLILALGAGLLFAAPISVTKGEHCTVRKHIKVYEAPAWIAKVETKTGKTAYFCSPKSMFEYYFEPFKRKDLGAESPDDVVSITVTDFKTLDAIDGRKAYYVYGSRKISPAGDDLVPFATLKDAEAYAKANRGMRIFKFEEVKNSLIRLLNGRI